MNNATKNKWLMIAVLLLLAANMATLAVFWINKEKKPSPLKGGGAAADFIIREVGFDSQQQRQYRELIKEHRRGAEQIRRQIHDAKNQFFELLQQPSVSDSVKKAAAIAANEGAMQLDLQTFDHFRKVRELCRPDQQQKFDRIIHNALRMMAAPPPGGPPGGQHGPPPGDGNGPPPPGP